MTLLPDYRSVNGSEHPRRRRILTVVAFGMTVM